MTRMLRVLSFDKLRYLTVYPVTAINIQSENGMTDSARVMKVKSSTGTSLINLTSRFTPLSMQQKKM